MAVKMIMPGAMTTIQDAGRFGYQAYGIAVSGAMDERAYAQANYLVGNPAGEAVLEMVLFGGALEVTEDTVAAVTGADMEPTIDGEKVPMNRPLLLKKGQTLAFGEARSGCRTYVAFAGGINVPEVMGSRSTNLKCRIGGLEGRALRAGDVLELGEAKREFYEICDRRTEPYAKQEILEIRVIEGPQEDCFTEKGKQDFYSGIYTITEQSDRMGYRLQGPAVESVAGTDIISDAIPLGAVQVPRNGQPIVLLKDRQTTGGYAKIAVACSFDLPRLVQGRPGDKVRFRKISVEKAEQINRERGKQYGL